MSSNGQEIFIVNEFSKKHSPQADTHKLFLKVLENILASISESSLDLSYADKHEEGTAIKQASSSKKCPPFVLMTHKKAHFTLHVQQLVVGHWFYSISFFFWLENTHVKLILRFCFEEHIWICNMRYVFVFFTFLRCILRMSEIIMNV